MNQKNFYKHLFSKCSKATFSLTTLPNKKIHHFDNLDEMIESIPKCKTNAYINICPRRENMPNNVRGGSDDMKYLPCIFADIDVKSEAHKSDNLPETKDEAIMFLKSISITPTYIVDSGYGVYAFWVFDETYLIGNEDNRLKANSVLSGYGKYLISKFKENDWQLDNVFDLPRMLRAPDSKNYKLTEPVDCKVLEFNNVFYEISNFESYADEIIEYEEVEFEADERVIGSAERIMEQCPFIKKMIDEPNNVTEPEWQAMCSNIVLTPDGKELFHKWSSLYDGYTFDETQYKIDRALVSKKPCTCKYINQCLGFDCEGCGVKAPVVLSHYSKLEQLQTLPEKLTADEIYEDYLLKLASYAKEHLPAEYGKLKIKVKRSGVGLRDFERAVNNYIDKYTPLEFDVVQKKISLDGIDLNGAIEPVGYQISLDEGICSVRY